MSKKKNLIAGMILICLIGIYIALQLGLIEPKVVDTPSDYELAEAIFTSEKDEITAMYITNPDGSFFFKKNEENWICQEKPEIELEQAYVNSLSWDYITLKPTRTIEEQASDFEQYGLHQPQASIRLVLKDGSEITFLLGNEVEGGGGYYFMKENDSTVYLMSSLECTNILHPLSFYRKSSLFTVAEESIKSVFYQIGETSYRIHRVTNQQWEMTEPYPREVYGNSFSESFITPALALNIIAFYDDLTADECGLEKPAYQLQLSAGEETDVLLIGNENEGGICYAMWESKGNVFGITKESLAFLDTNPLTFMMPYVYLPHIETVESFTGTIQGNEFSMVLKRTEGETEYYFNDKKVNSDVWKEKFQVLLTAEIVDFTNDAAIDGEPTIAYTAKLIDGTETNIAFYPMDERNYAVTYNGKVCFVINKNTIDTLIENF